MIFLLYKQVVPQIKPLVLDQLCVNNFSRLLLFYMLQESNDTNIYDNHNDNKIDIWAIMMIIIITVNVTFLRVWKGFLYVH